MNILRRLKLRHLETFVEVARQKSVSRAAENLNLTQPAVTRTIRELEEICGKPLVEKDGRGIRIGTEKRPDNRNLFWTTTKKPKAWRVYP